MILEGRDGAGKDGTIKRLTEHMSPRETRVHAPGKPSNREETRMVFPALRAVPAGGEEFVVFNRSWYNRAGVERVMGFCTEEQVEEFFESVVPFERMLVRDGMDLRKYYLDISKREQKKRLEARKDDPLKQWKISPVDAAALKKWKAYSDARDEMFERTSQRQGHGASCAPTTRRSRASNCYAICCRASTTRARTRNSSSPTAMSCSNGRTTR